MSNTAHRCFRALFLVAMVTTSFGISAKEYPNITKVIVRGGDPAQPAILDPDGDYASKYMKKASKISPVRIGNKRWVSVTFPVKLHKKEQVCENRSAEIHPHGVGFMIVESSSFFEPMKLKKSKFICEGKFEKKEVSAPTLEHYLLGKWAFSALRDPVVAMEGDKKDPLCIRGSMVSCPSSAQRTARYETSRLLDSGSCRYSESRCVAVTLEFKEKLNQTMNGVEFLAFEVRFRDMNTPDRFELVNFDMHRAPMVAPPLPGAPPIESTLPAND